jgi:hypothetical protein
MAFPFAALAFTVLAIAASSISRDVSSTDGPEGRENGQARRGLARSDFV